MSTKLSEAGGPGRPALATASLIGSPGARIVSMPRSTPTRCWTRVAAPRAATAAPMSRDAIRAQRAGRPARRSPAAAAKSAAPVFGWISTPFIPSERSQGIPSG